MLLLKTLEDGLELYGRKPDYWADDVIYCIKALQRAIDRQNIVASDLPKGVDDEDASKFMQGVIRQLGELVQVWPHLYASRELHNRGVLLCKPI